MPFVGDTSWTWVAAQWLLQRVCGCLLYNSAYCFLELILFLSTVRFSVGSLLACMLVNMIWSRWTSFISHRAIAGLLGPGWFSWEACNSRSPSGACAWQGAMPCSVCSSQALLVTCHTLAKRIGDGSARRVQPPENCRRLNEDAPEDSYVCRLHKAHSEKGSKATGHW